jgi:hypothetical protein
MATDSPASLQGCAAFQIMTDLSILSQFYVYRGNTDLPLGAAV